MKEAAPERRTERMREQGAPGGGGFRAVGARALGSRRPSRVVAERAVAGGQSHRAAVDRRRHGRGEQCRPRAEGEQPLDGDAAEEAAQGRGEADPQRRAPQLRRGQPRGGDQPEHDLRCNVVEVRQDQQGQRNSGHRQCQSAGNHDDQACRDNQQPCQCLHGSEPARGWEPGPARRWQQWPQDRDRPRPGPPQGAPPGSCRCRPRTGRPSPPISLRPGSRLVRHRSERGHRARRRVRRARRGKLRRSGVVPPWRRRPSRR